MHLQHHPTSENQSRILSIAVPSVSHGTCTGISIRWRKSTRCHLDILINVKHFQALHYLISASPTVCDSPAREFSGKAAPGSLQRNDIEPTRSGSWHLSHRGLCKGTDNSLRPPWSSDFGRQPKGQLRGGGWSARRILPKICPKEVDGHQNMRRTWCSPKPCAQRSTVYLPVRSVEDRLSFENNYFPVLKSGP